MTTPTTQPFFFFIVDQEDEDMDLRILDDILKYTQENQYTQEWINKRKHELIQHFEAVK